MGFKPPTKAAPTDEEKRKRDAPSAWDSPAKLKALADRFPKLPRYAATLDPRLWNDVNIEPNGEPGHYLMWGAADSIASGEVPPRILAEELGQ
jgi:hypothetical protein